MARKIYFKNVVNLDSAAIVPGYKVIGYNSGDELSNLSEKNDLGDIREIGGGGADNGLTLNVDTVELGGTLISSTSIDLDVYDLNIVKDSSSLFYVGNDGYIGVGTASPTNKLHIYDTVSGAFRLQDTTEGLNKILTSDVNGVGTWVTASVNSNHIYVDNIYGDDSTGLPYNMNKPYNTIDAASNIAQLGDMIVTANGQYTIYNSIRPGIIYNFGYSDIMIYSYISDYYGGPGIYTIVGNSNITCYSLINVLSTSTVNIDCNSILYNSTLLINVSGVINIKTRLIKSIGGLLLAYLGGGASGSTGVEYNIYADSYDIKGGFDFRSSLTNGITIKVNLYGDRLITAGTYVYYSWLVAGAKYSTINIYVKDIVINTPTYASIWMQVGVIDVYSKITNLLDTNIVITTNSIVTLHEVVDSTLGVFVTGNGGTLILNKEFISNRPNTCIFVSGTGTLILNSNVKSTDVASINPVITISAGTIVLNNSKIIADVSKSPITSTDVLPSVIKVFGNCYSITAPVNVTQEPETITQYLSLQ